MAIKYNIDNLDARKQKEGFQRRFSGTGKTKAGATIDISLLGSSEGATVGAFSGRDLNEVITYDPDNWRMSTTLNDVSYGNKKFLKVMFDAA
ncbi:MAG: hypothetical protein CL432_04175, partial [Acidimicrobiaceae bacterium]|nr:hypothetical protein [Acidimicrobiaceae bacterium]